MKLIKALSELSRRSIATNISSCADQTSSHLPIERQPSPTRIDRRVEAAMANDPDVVQTNGVKANGVAPTAEAKTPFLIGVAGGTASGKVRKSLFNLEYLDFRK